MTPYQRFSFLLSFCNCAYVRVLFQFVHWRRPKGTARQTTPLTAAFTQTAKAARCRPSTGAPTPALSQSRMSLPTGRSCVESPARCCQAPALQTDSLFLCPPASCLLPSESRSGDELKTLQETLSTFIFPPGKRHVNPFVVPPPSRP